MSSLAKFVSFLQDRKVALEDLEQFTELIESIQHSEGWRGYRLRPLTKADRVTQRCKVLVHFTWHCRDYVLRILAEHWVANPGQVVNRYIAASQEVQLVSCLANEQKHAGIDPNKQPWAVDISPRYGKPFVIGQMLDFPAALKPTLMSWGDSFPEFEFTGRAGIGGQEFAFTGFDWKYSCNIEDKDGKGIGNAWGLCEVTFQTWIKILADHGISI